MTTAGGQVITVTPDDDAAAAVGRHLAPDLTLHPARTDVGMVHRRIGDLDVHLVVNTGPHSRRQRALPRSLHRHLEVWDPVDGRVLDAVTDPGGHGVEIVLAPYQAVVLVGHDDLVGHDELGGHDEVSPSAVPVSRADDATAERTRLDAGWRLLRPDGTDLGEVSLPHRWEDDPRVGPDHSGTLAYETTIAAPADAGPIRLDLGEGLAAQDSGAGRESGIEGHSYRVRLAPPVGEVVRVLVDESRWRRCGHRRTSAT